MEDLRWVGEIRLWPGRCHPGAKGHMPSGMRGWAAGPVHGAVSTWALPHGGQVSCTGARPCVPAFPLCWAPALAPNWHQLLRVVPALGAPRGVGGNPRDWLGIWALKHTRPLLPPRWAPRLSTRGCQLPPGTPSPACPPKASVATGRPRKASPGVRDPRASWKGSCPSLGVVQGGGAHLLSPRGGALAPPGGSDSPAQAQGAAWNLRSVVGESSIPFAIPAGGAGVTCDGCRGTQLGESETLARSPGARMRRGRPGCTACVQLCTHRFIHASAPAVLEPAVSRCHARDSAVHGGQCNTGGWVTEGLGGMTGASSATLLAAHLWCVLFRQDAD